MKPIARKSPNVNKSGQPSKRQLLREARALRASRMGIITFPDGSTVSADNPDGPLLAPPRRQRSR